MTHITFYRSERSGYRGYEANGHAQDITEGEYGLVCGAVSVLTITGVNALERVAQLTPVASVQDGYIACFLPQGLNDAQWQDAQTILRTIREGLCDLEKQYPEFISYREQEASKCLP